HHELPVSEITADRDLAATDTQGRRPGHIVDDLHRAEVYIEKPLRGETSAIRQHHIDTIIAEGDNVGAAVPVHIGRGSDVVCLAPAILVRERPGREARRLETAPV